MNILVTSVGSLTSLNIINILKQKKHFVLGIDAKNKPKSKQLDKFFNCPLANDENAYIGFILNLCKIEGIDCIVPLSTSETKAISNNLNIFDRNNIKVKTSPLESIGLCQDKFKFYDFCKYNHIETPDYFLCKSSKDIEKFYALKHKKQTCIKPRFGEGSRGFRVIKSQSLDDLLSTKSSIEVSLDEILKICGEQSFEILAMEYLSGKEYSVDILAKDGKVLQVAIRTRDVVVDGFSHKATFVEDNSISSVCVRLVDKLNLNGLVGFQFKENESGLPVILECNPRVQGGIFFAQKAGIDFIDSYLELCNDKVISSKPYDLISVER
tara:strand:+ start:2590 stop:3564 length:975 start_codon:yes stop_codon:yes gene_type:complete